MGNENLEEDAQLRTLALIDRVLGLEAEIAHLKYDRGQGLASDLQNTFTWKVGRIVTFPVRWMRKLIRKIK